MKFVKLTALLLALVLLTGCTALQTAPNGTQITKFEDMTYSRPNLNQLQRALDTALESAQETKVRDILDAVYGFYDEYDAFYTNYALADIHTSQNLTDIYWEQEYAWCMENISAADAALEELYRALAVSPAREQLESDAYFGPGFFDSYEGDSVYDEGFLALLEQEAALQSQYYALSSEALDYEEGSEAYYEACGNDMAALLVELIALRQEMADYWGYDSYPQFANDFYYYRDYTMDEAEDYLADIARELVPLYRELDMTPIWDKSYTYSSEQDTLNFVKQTAKQLGGQIWDAFSLMDKAGLYDITYSENKFSASFEVYLTSYYEPFLFMNPELTRYDCLTLAHEFGHFCNDYACYGSYAGVDVLEFFSQGMEYLSLCYGEDTEDLTMIKMADSLCLYVEQAAFAAFEQQMYGLTGEALSVEGLCTLYQQIALEYGFDSAAYDPREFVTIPHFYTNPMYILSYIVSNDAAMQLYQLEQAEPGAGKQLYEENLASQEVWFLAFLETAGLESPFAEGRVTQIAETFQSVLG